MKIAIDLNGVIRDIFTKTEQVYTKFYLDDVEGDEEVNEYDESTEEWVKKEKEEDPFKSIAIFINRIYLIFYLLKDF